MILKTKDSQRETSTVSKCQCVLCGSTCCGKFLTVDEYRLVQCRRCQVVFISPQLPKPKLEKLRATLYNSDDYKEMYFSSRQKLRRRFAKSLSEIRRYKKRGRLLDVGCSYGFFLEMAAGTWKVYGVEVCERSSRYARNQLGLNVFTGCLSEASFPNQYFDVVTMWDVLEHLPSPKNALCEVARILKDGGLLFLQCPNIDSLMARLTKYKGWGWLDVPDHLFHFSPRSLTLLLQKSNLRVIKIKTWEPLNEFLDNLFALVDLGHPFRAGSRVAYLYSRIMTAIKNGLLFVFIPTVWPLQMVWWKLGKGGLIQVYAQKE